MLYFVQIEENKIVGMGYVDVDRPLMEDERPISHDLYQQLTNLPADFETDTEGNIISVTPAPEPAPELQDTPTPTLAELQAQQLAQAEAIAAIFEMLTGGET